MPRQLRVVGQPFEIGRRVDVVPAGPEIDREAAAPCRGGGLIEAVRRRPGNAVKHRRVHAAACDRVISAVVAWPERNVCRRIEQRADMRGRKGRSIAAHDESLGAPLPKSVAQGLKHF